MKILVVDDEQDICEILQYNLETDGYEVDVANSAEEALNLSLDSYDLILLDVMMGEISGFQMAHKLRNTPSTSQIPIIFITALDNEDNIVKGLNIGADDYMVKPLSMREVKARVAAVLRRSSQGSNKAMVDEVVQKANVVSCDGLAINIDSKIATLDGVPIVLTRLELELLLLLLQNPGKVFTRNDLLRYCWPQDVFVLDRTVDVNITRLRKKIGAYGKMIKTRVGYGYCFEK